MAVFVLGRVRERELERERRARFVLRPDVDEVERLTGELSAILEAVSKVSELDLSDVPPTSHPLELVNAWDEDEPRPSLPLEVALANAPEDEDGHFRVPPTGMTRES